MRTRNTDIEWIELHGEAHIILDDRYRDRTLCGQDLDDATLVMAGDDLNGCITCITRYAETNTDKRPARPEEDHGWPASAPSNE